MLQATLKRQTSQDMKFHYSVIIPAYNEEAFLPETLECLKLAMATVLQQGEIEGDGDACRGAFKAL